MIGIPCPLCGGAWKQLTPGHSRLTHRKGCARSFAARAQAIEAQRAATVKQGAVEDESAVNEVDAPKGSSK